MKSIEWKAGKRFDVRIDYAQVVNNNKSILAVPMKIRDKKNNRLYSRVGHHILAKTVFNTTFVSWQGQVYNVNDFLKVR